MRILVLNVGSSSVKYSLYDNKKFLQNGIIERIGKKKTYEQAIKTILKKNNKIEVIGHRVVHGGNIKKSIVLTNNIIKKLWKIAELAPLHNIPELKVIKICKKLKIPQIAIFDTSFHQSIPEKANIYGLPYKFYKDGIKRYGFHGTSCKYILRKIKGNKIIICHLGNGCSITAIKNRKSFDTSMGFTPLEGLIMGCRSGNLDPAIVLYLLKNKKINEVSNILNNKSGLLGISGISNDIRDLKKSKNKRAKLALDVFTYRIVKYIGAYIAAMNGINSIVFTGGIGENAHYLRKDILRNFEFLGLKLDNNKNTKNKEIISIKSSKIKVFVIKTNEEIMMVEEVLRVLNKH
tara:strand:+ start:203 stop:1246 length:1044 start_codon:yes stop_codon:yes gene_type:complete